MLKCVDDLKTLLGVFFLGQQFLDFLECLEPFKGLLFLRGSAIDSDDDSRRSRQSRHTRPIHPRYYRASVSVIHEVQTVSVPKFQLSASW